MPYLTTRTASHIGRKLYGLTLTQSRHLLPQTSTVPTVLGERRSLLPYRRTMATATATSRIAVLGAGTVGSTVAYSLILNPVAGEILLVDRQTSVLAAQVQDLSDATYHGAPASHVRVRAASPQEAGQADVVVLTAGANQKKGESRTDLVGRNLKILRSAIEYMKPFRADAVLLVVANPVDVLTFFAQRWAGLPRRQVLGSGTFLDSARLRGVLAEKAGVAASSVQADVLGEHGESQFVAWSGARVVGVPIDRVVGGGPGEKKEIDHEAVAKDTRQKAAAIMESKGATNYGIAGVAASICKSILFDERNVVPISHYREDLGCCLSLPVVLGSKGVVRAMPVSLSKEEDGFLRASAESLRQVIKDAEKS